MHQETKPGEATPAEAESIVGAQVDFDRMGAAACDGEEKIYKYVQEPLRKWLANFDTVVVRAAPPRTWTAMLGARLTGAWARADCGANSGAAAADARLAAALRRHHRRCASSSPTCRRSLRMCRDKPPVRVASASLTHRACAFAGDITNLQTKTSNPEDPKLIRCVQRKHRQEAKMLRAHPRLPSGRSPCATLGAACAPARARERTA